MKRKVIKIDEAKCTGCAKCIPGCPEGAIQIIDGKARLVSDLFCDGLGACIGVCPYGAISIEEREAEDYDERKVIQNVIKQGKNTIKAHLKHLKEHGQEKYFQEAIDFLKEQGIDIADDEDGQESHQHVCPSAKMMYMKSEKNFKTNTEEDVNENLPGLINWPVELALINPQAPYFKEEKELVIAADCTAFSYPAFHKKFLKGRPLIIFCPKLDKTIDAYLEKLVSIFQNGQIEKVILIHMEVPCCFGLNKIVEEAIKISGKKVIINEYTISIKGNII